MLVPIRRVFDLFRFVDMSVVIRNDILFVLILLFFELLDNLVSIKLGRLLHLRNVGAWFGLLWRFKVIIGTKHQVILTHDSHPADTRRTLSNNLQMVVPVALLSIYFWYAHDGVDVFAECFKRS